MWLSRRCVGISSEIEDLFVFASCLFLGCDVVRVVDGTRNGKRSTQASLIQAKFVVVFEFLPRRMLSYQAQVRKREAKNLIMSAYRPPGSKGIQLRPFY
eukprot:scaffold294_cov221-Amphora_coffeaeformis.AAC.51